ncbi:MAG: tetratricopeptide repeat protein [Desulfatibacillaceae bacterium]|nr:tetratricopeptide repeat protein [Desulfatibacillaceae bacterium]
MLKRRSGVFFKAILLSLLAFSILGGCSVKLTQPDPATPLAEKDSNLEKASGTAYFLFAQAMLLEQQGNPDRARSYLERAVAEDSKALAPRVELGRILLGQEDFSAAKIQMQKALELYPEKEDILAMAAAAFIGLEEYDPALEAYQKLFEMSPERIELLYAIGEIYFQMENWDKALEIFLDLAAREPDSLRAWLYLAETHIRRGDNRAAIDALERSLTINPNLTQAIFRLIGLYEAEGLDDQVVAAYEELLERFPADLKVFFGLAGFYLDKGMKGRAGQVLSMLRTSLPPDGELDEKIGLFYLERGHLDEAVRILDELVSQGGGTPDTAYFLGVALEEAQDLETAAIAYGKVRPGTRFHIQALISKARSTGDEKDVAAALFYTRKHWDENGKDRATLLLAADLLQRLNKHEQAISLLEEGIAEFENDIPMLFRLGVALDQAGRKEDCIAIMRRVLEIDPGNPEALNYIGYTHAEMGIQLDEALEMVERALQARPDDGYITDSLGWVHFQRGSYEKALEILEKAILLVNDEPVILDHLGDAYLKNNMPQKAMEAFQRALDMLMDMPPRLTSSQQDDKERIESLKEKIHQLEQELGQQ